MGKYFKIFINRFQTNLEYRSNLVVVFLLELLPIAAVLILWQNIYTENNTIAGYNISDIVIYYIFVPLIGFITMSTVVEDLPEEIKYGNFSNQLIKPFNIWLTAFADNLAKKVIVLFLVLPIYLVLLFALQTFFSLEVLNLTTVSVALLFGVLALLLHTVLDFSITWLTFWFDEIWAFSHLKEIAFGILGGVMFPFEFLPTNVRWLFEVLPFKYMYYVPVSYIVGKRGLDNVFADLLGLLIWTAILLLVGLVLWRKGLKKYGAFGN